MSFNVTVSEDRYGFEHFSYSEATSITAYAVVDCESENGDIKYTERRGVIWSAANAAPTPAREFAEELIAAAKWAEEQDLRGIKGE